MGFLRAGLSNDIPLTVESQGLILRPPTMADYRAWANVRTRSREHLVRWEPEWGRDDLTRSAFRRRLRHYHREAREDLGYAFLILEEDDGPLCGGITLSNVRRGVTQAASLGYWLSLEKTGQGLMTRAIRTLIPFSFEELRLHRIEAACMLDNDPSIRVLERCGFSREGIARKYLKINGAWRDHLLFALVHEDWRGGECLGDAVEAAEEA